MSWIKRLRGNSFRFLRVGVPFSIIILVISSCASDAELPAPLTLTQEQLLWGQELVRGLAACGSCHGIKPDPNEPLAGGQVYHDQFGEVIVPNITRDSESGIGDWSVTEIARVLRGHRSKKEDHLSLEAHTGFEWLSDFDLFAIVHYVRALPPVKNQVERRELTFVDRNTTGFFERWTEVKGFIPRIQRAENQEWGRYLVNHIARCGSCHDLPGTLLTERLYMAGGQTIRRGDRSAIAPNITADREYGIGAWSESEIMYYLQTGRTPGNIVRDPVLCPTPFYRNASHQDLRAIAIYLKTLVP